MAPWLNFLIPLTFAFVGMALWVIVGGWRGVALFLLCFLAGSIAGSRVFKRYATKKQIREDLEARVAEARFKYK